MRESTKDYEHDLGSNFSLFVDVIVFYSGGDSWRRRDEGVGTRRLLYVRSFYHLFCKHAAHNFFSWGGCGGPPGLVKY